MKTTYSESRNYLVFFLLLSSLLASVCTGCGEEKSVIIRQKVAERVYDFRQKKSQECRQNLLAQAEEIVDSLLLTEATNALGDSLSRLRPYRPVQPPPIPPIDSLQVQPLFEKLQPLPDSGGK